MGRQVRLIGSAIGNCGRGTGCELTPDLVYQGLLLKYPQLTQMTSLYRGEKGNIQQLHNYFTIISDLVVNTLDADCFPLLLGGDHACAIGSWSGVASALAKDNSELGLIWVDAHLDAHRPETSQSGNLHGMPVAHLLGYGHTEFTTIGFGGAKLKPQNLVYFAARSFESAEEDFLQQLGVKIYYRHLLTHKNFTHLFTNEFERLACQTNGNVGISLDLDALDPNEIMAVSVPEENGISPQLFLDTIMQLDTGKLRAFEIAEYNPLLDNNNQSFNYMLNFLTQLINKVDYDHDTSKNSQSRVSYSTPPLCHGGGSRIGSASSN